jgi:hypothetical protein
VLVADPLGPADARAVDGDAQAAALGALDGAGDRGLDLLDPATGSAAIRTGEPA